MSLLKQLLLSVTVAIVFILAGTLVFSIDGARQYLNAQLQAQSENAASSLALSLSQPANQDEITRELLITALYDSGQFRQVRFTGVDGHVMVDRSLDPAAGAGLAPRWFSDLLPLSTPTAVRFVSDGWKQVGELSVTSDDLSARDSLWRSSMRVFALVVGAGLLWALFAILLIRWLKRALSEEITEQVRAIADGGQTAPARSRPRVAELAQATRMIRDVRERVTATAQEQHGQIESLQFELNRDPVTGLANRRYFLNELRSALLMQGGQGQEAVAGGHVLIFRQRDLAAINTAMTRMGVDEWLHSVGARVNQVLEALPEPRPQLARLNGSDFVLLMPGFNGPEATRFVQRIRQVLLPLRIQVGTGHLCRWALALTNYTPACDISGVLARLDQGLMRAESAGHDDVEYMPFGEQGKGQAGTSESEWRTLISDALAQNRLALKVRPLTYVAGSDYAKSSEAGGGSAASSLESEDSDWGTVDGMMSNAGPTVQLFDASLIMRDDDQGELSGYLFMPPAVRLGLSGDCDLRAIDLALEWLDQNEGDLIVKVSLPSLTQPRFLSSLNQHLQGLNARVELTRRLTLELDAHGLVAYGDDVRTFCEEVVKAGSRVGLRRLAQQPAAIMNLHRATLDYVKLGGEFVEHLLSSPGSLRLLTAVAETTEQLGIRVYADDASDPDTVDVLQEQGVYTAA